MSDQASKLSQQAATRLHSAAIRLLRSLRRHDQESGLSGPRLSALSVVVYAGPLTLGALAEAEQVRPPTMSRLVTALESSGLVTRERSHQDGRAVRITATDHGKEVLERGRLRRVEALTNQLDQLTREQVEQLDRAAALILDLFAAPLPQRHGSVKRESERNSASVKE